MTSLKRLARISPCTAQTGRIRFPPASREGPSSAQGALKRRAPRCQLLRQSVAQRSQQLVVQLELALPFRHVDRADALVLVAIEALETPPLEVREGGRVADGRL